MPGCGRIRAAVFWRIQSTANGAHGRRRLFALLGTLAHDLAHDEGLVVEEGTPADIFDRPQEERTRKFLSKVL